MKYKITNLTEASVRYDKVLFAPKETKVLELDKPYSHNYFHIEELEEKEQKKSLKGGK